MFICLQKCLNVFDEKFVLTSESTFFESPYSAETSLVIGTRLSAERLFTFFTIGVIYNAKKSFIINYKNISTNYFPRSAWYIIM